PRRRFLRAGWSIHATRAPGGLSTRPGLRVVYPRDQGSGSAHFPPDARTTTFGRSIELIDPPVLHGRALCVGRRVAVAGEALAPVDLPAALPVGLERVVVL